MTYRWGLFLSVVGFGTEAVADAVYIPRRRPILLLKPFLPPYSLYQSKCLLSADETYTAMVYKILTACGSAAASASSAKTKIEDNLPDRGIPKREINVQLVRIKELGSQIDNADAAVVMSGNMPNVDSDVPMVKGINLMTGINEDQVYDELAAALEE